MLFAKLRTQMSGVGYDFAMAISTSRMSKICVTSLKILDMRLVDMPMSKNHKPEIWVGILANNNPLPPGSICKSALLADCACIS